MTTHDSNPHNEGPWCDDCHGYTHMPWCPHYIEKVSEVVSEAKSIPSGDCEAVAGQCRERCDGSNKQETEQLIARIHAAMAEDCDCPQHRTEAAKIDPAVLKRISAAITRDQTFASLTTVRAAIADVVDGAEFYQWMWDTNEVNANAVRGEFMDAVCARILALQREPHGMDAELREDALESQEFYELMQAYRHAAVTDQNATVAAFNAVKSFVGRAGDGGTGRQQVSSTREADTAIDEYVERIAEIIQAQTACSEAAKDDLKLALAEFADEVKRQAVEP